MTLKSLRKKIDHIDSQILKSLNQRAGLTLAIGKLKSKKGLEIYDPSREQQILGSLMHKNKGPLNNDSLRGIYAEIMSAALNLERPIKIAYLGPEATFTHLASLKKFGSQVSYISCASIADVFAEVEKEQADYGVVPVENSVEGAVTHTLDMFADTDLKICAEIILDIALNLMSKAKSLKQIDKIYSNPQVFGQCRSWLKSHLPKIDLVETASTTKAAQIAAKDKHAAAIASVIAAKTYRLRIIAASIEDSPHNVTRFLVIGKKAAQSSGKDKTSILFSIKDRVGALHDMLIPFKKYKINLTKIESRPSKRKAWDYYFFVDFLGHRKDARVRKALKELEAQCTYLKVLGSYPRVIK
jgi:chorismate mutase/prephenate dehydratase